MFKVSAHLYIFLVTKESIALWGLFVFQRFKKAAAQHPIEIAAATHQHSSSFSIDKVSGVCVLINHNPRAQERRRRRVHIHSGVSLSLFFFRLHHQGVALPTPRIEKTCCSP